MLLCARQSLKVGLPVGYAVIVAALAFRSMENLKIQEQAGGIGETSRSSDLSAAFLVAAHRELRMAVDWYWYLVGMGLGGANLCINVSREKLHFVSCATSATIGLLRYLFGDPTVHLGLYLRVLMLACAVVTGMAILRRHEPVRVAVRREA